MAWYATRLPLYSPRCFRCTRTYFAGCVCTSGYCCNLIG